MYLVLAVLFNRLSELCEQASHWAYLHADPAVRVAPPPKRTPPTWRDRNK